MKGAESIQQNENQTVDISKDTISFLIFSVNNHRLGIEISLVQEIVRDTKVHFLPFVPSYIEGLINYSGKPYTVVNPVVLEKNPHGPLIEISSPTFLLFKREDDHFCLHISMVEIFYEVQKEDLEDEDWEDEIEYRGEKIPLIKPDEIEELLKHDLGA
ncbi:MAG: chemotaxis protein CheW [Treponema sp.]|nr:chemotaxis protein CheW [Treponema sp.]